eukprot:2443877-Alexandrium_andersonii.AAC.1
MSASLVGSEMCIRDRRRTEFAVLHAFTKVQLRAARVLGDGSRCPPAQTACLLYTSDAADDM